MFGSGAISVPSVFDQIDQSERFIIFYAEHDRGYSLDGFAACVSDASHFSFFLHCSCMSPTIDKPQDPALAR